MSLPQEWTNIPIADESLYLILRSILRNWWYDQRRNYPWREANDPYALLLAEFILQKTQVAKALPAYSDLIEIYPTIQAMSLAPDEHLQRIFSWLGLVKRAQFLKRSCQIIVKDYQGQVPNNLSELKKLPGLGDYTASAILCFAYSKPVPIVDTTIARLLKRLLGFDSLKAAWEDPVTWSIARNFLDKGHPVEHNYGLLDHAALICLPKILQCPDCPFLKHCEFAKKIHSFKTFREIIFSSKKLGDM